MQFMQNINISSNLRKMDTFLKRKTPTAQLPKKRKSRKYKKNYDKEFIKYCFTCMSFLFLMFAVLSMSF